IRMNSLKRWSIGAAMFLALAAGIALGVAGVPTQQAKLVAGDSPSVGAYDSSVGLAGDTAVVGGFDPTQQRAAYVFKRTGTAWTQEAKLTGAAEVAYDPYGVSVALAGDTAALGSPGGSGGRGAVYVFKRTGTTWTREATLTPLDSAIGDFFGV